MVKPNGEYMKKFMIISTLLSIGQISLTSQESSFNFNKEALRESIPLKNSIKAISEAFNTTDIKTLDRNRDILLREGLKSAIATAVWIPAATICRKSPKLINRAVSTFFGMHAIELPIVYYGNSFIQTKIAAIESEKKPLNITMDQVKLFLNKWF